MVALVIKWIFAVTGVVGHIKHGYRAGNLLGAELEERKIYCCLGV